MTKTALLSVFDKTGLLEFAQGLHGLGIRILSTGGTLKFLKEKGIPAVAISEYTGSPEILDGRVKTLHPKIHGGFLGVRDNEDHQRQMRENGIEPIDIVAVNLYPFRETVAKPNVKLEEAIENIDIGGPAMLRSSAKNFRFVSVICDPSDYTRVLNELKAEGDTSPATRQALALKAFRHTADYDSAIDEYLSATLTQSPSLRLSFAEGRTLRYGENDHQKATFFLEKDARSGKEPNIGSARQLHGKELSFNNLVDADAALESVRELHAEPAVSIIKHMNPCGYATGATLAEAFEAAWEGDPVSAFGGIIAFNQPLDVATAQSILDRQFVEVVIAPEIDAAALAAFAKRPNVRVLASGDWPEQPAPTLDFKRISGGLLAQDTDRDTLLLSDLKVVSRRVPDADELRDLLFAWHVAMYVKSNAIVYARQGCTIGIGAGQMSRVISAKIAALKAEEAGLDVAGSVMASDAFFPFRDGIDAAAKAGIRAVIQPGGSMRDAESIAAADEHGMAMVFTGVRHFRH